jgi:hypothetical protein
MPLYDVALQIDVVPGTDPTVVVRGVNAAGGTSPTTEELLTLYQEVGEHERHYSNIRMTATALLFTIAVLAIGGVYDKLIAARGIGLLYFCAAPVVFILFSLVVNWYYSIISVNARRLEQHLENLLRLQLDGTPHGVTQPDALFFRTFERLQRDNPKDDQYNRNDRPTDTAGFVGEFEGAIARGKKVHTRAFDGPFMIVLALCVLVLAGLGALAAFPFSLAVQAEAIPKTPQYVPLADYLKGQSDLNARFDQLKDQIRNQPQVSNVSPILGDRAQQSLSDVVTALQSIAKEMAARQTPPVSQPPPQSVNPGRGRHP